MKGEGDLVDAEMFDVDGASPKLALLLTGCIAVDQAVLAVFRRERAGQRRSADSVLVFLRCVLDPFRVGTPYFVVEPVGGVDIEIIVLVLAEIECQTFQCVKEMEWFGTRHECKVTVGPRLRKT